MAQPMFVPGYIVYDQKDSLLATRKKCKHDDSLVCIDDGTDNVLCSDCRSVLNFCVCCGDIRAVSTLRRNKNMCGKCLNEAKQAEISSQCEDPPTDNPDEDFEEDEIKFDEEVKGDEVNFDEVKGDEEDFDEPSDFAVQGSPREEYVRTERADIPQEVPVEEEVEETYLPKRRRVVNDDDDL